MPDWNVLVREHGPAVLRIAYHILGDVTDAEDVMQDVFCEAWMIRESRTVANWAGLLRRMAALRAIDKLRRRRPHRSLSDHDFAREVALPPEVAMARELADSLRHRIGQLPEQQAAAFSLFYFERLSREEIAESLETTLGAVSTALSKARRELKSSLSGVLQEPNHEQR